MKVHQCQHIPVSVFLFVNIILKPRQGSVKTPSNSPLPQGVEVQERSRNGTWLSGVKERLDSVENGGCRSVNLRPKEMITPRVKVPWSYEWYTWFGLEVTPGGLYNKCSPNFPLKQLCHLIASLINEIEIIFKMCLLYIHPSMLF